MIKKTEKKLKEEYSEFFNNVVKEIIDEREKMIDMYRGLMAMLNADKKLELKREFGELLRKYENFINKKTSN